MKNLIITFFFSTLLSNCVVQKTIGNGAYSDLSLNVNDDKYNVKRLETINASGKAFWGIPENVDKKRGLVFRFNGIEIPKTGQFIPCLTLLGYTFTISSLVNSQIDNRAGSIAIAFPIAGALNNLTYPQAASSVASMNLNRELIQKNPDIDVFLNPKYDISFENSLWTQKAVIVGNVIGARLVTDNDEILSKKPSIKKNVVSAKKERKDVELKKVELTSEELAIILKDYNPYSKDVKLKKNNEIIFGKFGKYYRGKLKYSGTNSNGAFLIYNIFLFDNEVKTWKNYSSKSINVSPELIKGYKD